jgi:hypothetical protein
VKRSWAVAAGVALGAAYTLSPLTVLCIAALMALGWRIARELTPRERAWFASLAATAFALRLAAIAALFLLADPARPYATFFGDEELFKSRTVWLRNVGQGVPVSPADMIYAFDEVGRSSYLYALAYIQALVGDAPYGTNVLNSAIYVAAVMIMYWFMRRYFDGFTALAGAAFLWLVPSLFSWSISVLKEPLYILVAAIELIAAAYIVRAPTVVQRAAAVLAVALCALALNSLRVGGMQLAVIGTVVGLSAGLLASRPRLAMATIIALPVVLVVVAMQPRVQERALATLRVAAFQHWGHVATAGYSYKLLEPRFYGENSRLSTTTMTGPEAGRFVVRAFWSFVTVPRSSQIESRSVLAYLPEQALWYLLLLFTPIGVVAGMRRDAVVTCLLVAHGLTAAGMVALTGGNIGTLIRHRGLTLPYFTWLAALGAGTVIYWLAMRARAARSSAVPSGEPA